MLIRIIPNQIPQVWEQVKYAAVNTDRVENGNLQKYLNSLLQSLLNGKTQCFLRINDNRELLAVILTELRASYLDGEKSLFIKNIFSFKSVDSIEWEENMSSIDKYAKAMGCKTILGCSSNNRIFELALSLGFKESHRYFVKDLEV